MLCSLANLAFAGDFKLNSKEIERVSQTRYWKLLLHLGQSDDKEFYLSPEGAKNPAKEIEAEIEAFANPALIVGPRKQHPQCAFPERYRYLKSELHLPFESAACDEFHEWKKHLDAHAVTLVFASSYLNNPTSMFGHTFLRIDSGRSVQKDEGKNLWGYGINYGIEAGNSPIISVVIFGVIGGFNGYYAMLPYFEKVNEYNDSESRDLWEYTLNLSPEQIERLSNHLWELISTHFSYYFFNHNCTSQLLELLDVAVPEWHLQEKFFYAVIPADSLRVMSRIPGAISEIHFRPSLYRKLQQKYSDLNTNERVEFDIDAEKDFKIKGDETPETLDALVDFQDYQMMKNKKHLDDGQKSRRREILLAQARADRSPRTVAVATPSDRPDQGTDTSKVQTYFGTRDSKNYFGFRFRPALHDLIDSDTGYLPFSEVQIASLDFRYELTEPHSFHLQALDAVKMTSLNSIEYLNQTFSWTVGLGAFAPDDFFCGSGGSGCIAGRVFAGGGLAKSLSQNSILYALFKGNMQYSGVFNHALRAGPSAEFGAVYSPFKLFKVGAAAEAFYFPFQNKEAGSYMKTELKLSQQVLDRFEVRAAAAEFSRSAGSFFEYSAALGWYF